MAHPRAALKQSDLTRYAKALRAAGIGEFRIKLHPDGTVDFLVGKDNDTRRGPDPDELLRS
jgi:hypothetical protein